MEDWSSTGQILFITLPFHMQVTVFTASFFPFQTTDQYWIPCLHDETEKLFRKVK